jgi:hypothetical protein
MPLEITLQGSFAAGYTLIDNATGQPVSAVFKQLRHALTFALHRGAVIVYYQTSISTAELSGRPAY